MRYLQAGLLLRLTQSNSRHDPYDKPNPVSKSSIFTQFLPRNWGQWPLVALKVSSESGQILRAKVSGMPISNGKQRTRQEKQGHTRTVSQTSTENDSTLNRQGDAHRREQRGERGAGDRQVSDSNELGYEHRSGPSEPSRSPLERRKKEIVDSLMSKFMEWLNTRVGDVDEACVDGEAPGQSGKSSSASGSRGGGRGDQRTRQKRQFREDSPGGDGSNEGDQDGKGNKRVRNEDYEIEGPKFACPIYQNDPGKCTRSRACHGPGFRSVHRVKEHLYRCHTRQKYLCPRCFDTFGNDKALAAHCRSEPPCQVADINPRGHDIDEASEKALRARYNPKQQVKNEANKWKDMYMILFPDTAEDDIPSPYHEGTTSVVRCGLHRYLRRQLPPLVRQNLELEVEKRFHCAERELRRDCVNMIEDLVFKLIQTYEHQEQSDSPSSPTSSSPQTATATQPDLSPLPDILDEETAALYYGDLNLNEFLAQDGCTESNDCGSGNPIMPADTAYYY